MNVYQTEQVRNIILLGHGGAGKTTLAEAMSFVTGGIKRLGRVEDGNTISDYDKEETKRLFSISTALIPIEYEDCKINILDTPGYFDFIGEVTEALSVADGAVIVISGKAGVEVGVKKAWDYCEENNIPRIIFVTDMDDENANYMEIVEKLKKLYGKKIAPFHVPIRENDKFVGFINAVKMGGRRFNKDGTIVDCDIPDSVRDDLDPMRAMILEAVAESSEELMEKFFEGTEFTYDEISQGLRNGVVEGEIVPVQCGSGVNTLGVAILLQSIEKYMPSPKRKSLKLEGNNPISNKNIIVNYEDKEPLSAYVFKTIVDPFIGKFSLMKICSGILRPDMTVYNANKDMEERIGKIYTLRGKEQIELKELHAGDIGAVAKLFNTSTCDTLSTKANPVVFDAIEFPEALTGMAFNTKTKGDEDKVAQGLTKIMDEDKTVRYVNDKENRQTLLYAIGDQHLEVVVNKLLNRYKVEIELSRPKFAYRETIKKKVSVQGKHKKQSGGHGQYGDVHMDFEPSGDLATPYVFEEKVVGGAVPRNYFPAVEKGIQDCVLKGPLAGFPVVGIKATLTDGSYHAVDSSEMAFKMATTNAFKKGFLEANPVLLEPIAIVKVTVPNSDKYTGDAMGDLNKRRGRILGMNPIKEKLEIIAEVPMSEMFGYTTDLRSMTGGRGEYTYKFDRYEQAPSDVQKKVMEEYKADVEEN
ncbi:MAG: hypothetical protein K0R15_222 [Clostridiales bacterium]|jgi:elongation factor G|nr:hypothetical protein [Clostridiales bacterium]